MKPPLEREDPWTDVNIERAGVEERRIRRHVEYLRGVAAGLPDVVGRHLDPATTVVQRPEPEEFDGEGTPFRAPARRGRPPRPKPEPVNLHKAVQIGGGETDPSNHKGNPSPARPARSNGGLAGRGPHVSRGGPSAGPAPRLQKVAGEGDVLHATDSLQPVAVSGTSARRERDKDSPTYVPYRRRKYLRRREADAHLIESKEKRRGRTDVGGKTRKRIKAWLERERIARPHQTAMECKALAEAKFTVRITRANFYATYWAYTHPKEPA